MDRLNTTIANFKLREEVFHRRISGYKHETWKWAFLAILLMVILAVCVSVCFIAPDQEAIVAFTRSLRSLILRGDSFPETSTGYYSWFMAFFWH